MVFCFFLPSWNYVFCNSLLESDNVFKVQFSMGWKVVSNPISGKDLLKHNAVIPQPLCSCRTHSLTEPFATWQSSLSSLWHKSNLTAVFYGNISQIKYKTLNNHTLLPPTVSDEIKIFSICCCFPNFFGEFPLFHYLVSSFSKLLLREKKKKTTNGIS